MPARLFEASVWNDIYKILLNTTKLSVSVFGCCTLMGLGLMTRRTTKR